MFYFICGIIWIVLIGLCFWLICILVIKNLSVWMLTSCTKYQVFFWFNGITFLNPTVVEFHHPLLDHVCFKLLYDQNFKIISYFDFQKWILIPLMPSQWDGVKDIIVCLFPEQKKAYFMWIYQCILPKHGCKSNIKRHWLHLVFYR